jgi:hypothetical protein
MSPPGPSRHFAATPDVGRFQTEADMNRQARPAASVANDPKGNIVFRRYRITTGRIAALLVRRFSDRASEASGLLLLPSE